MKQTKKIFRKPVKRISTNPNKKISRKSLAILVVIIITVPLLIITVVPFTGVGLGDGSIYLESSNIIKNFDFYKFDGDVIPVSNIMYTDKLAFETQNVWTLEQDDIIQLTAYDVGNTTYLYYKVFMKNAINIFTSVALNQMSKKAEKVEESFLAGHYEHDAVLHENDFSWDSYITWQHWDFGDDVWNYNFDNNHFEGSLEMTFDIAQNPLPEIVGEFATKKFDYIAVSSAGVVSAEHGLMSKDVPEILTVIPEEYREEHSEEFGGDAGDIEGGFEAYWDPDTDLENLGITSSFDASMSYQESGSMFPKNKDGSSVWDPKDTGTSMTDCKIQYGVYSLSPVVMEYGGKLSWMEQQLGTKVVYEFPFKWVTKKDWYSERAQTEYGQIALHGWNRYIQTEMVVAFNIWTAVEIELLPEDYEYMKLHTPTEYYDMLIWSSLVGGFGGGKQYTADPVDPFSGFFDFLEDIIYFIIIIVVIGIGLYVFIKVGVPYMQKRTLEDKPKNEYSRYGGSHG